MDGFIKFISYPAHEAREPGPGMYTLGGRSRFIHTMLTVIKGEGTISASRAVKTWRILVKDYSAFLDPCEV